MPSIDLVAGDSANQSTLSNGELIGVTLDIEAGLASIIAAVVILILIFRRIQMDRQYEAMDIYVIALFTAEVIQGLGHAFSLKWVIEGELHVGTFCTAQAVLRQIGDLGVALATLTIAVQTFVAIWWLKDPSKLITFISVGIQWIVTTLIVGIGYGMHTKPPNEYYAHPVPYWCWIGQRYKSGWLGGEYVWLWLTLFVSFVLYLLLFLLDLRVIQPGRSWYAPTGPAHDESVEHRVKSNPGLWTVIWYPIVNCVIIMPLSIVRFIELKEVATFGKIRTSPVATLIVGIILGLTGVMDAILYRTTRAGIFMPKEKNEPQAPDVPANGEKGEAYQF